MTVHDAHLHLHAKPKQQQQYPRRRCRAGTPHAAHRVPTHAAVRGGVRGVQLAVANLVLHIAAKLGE